LRRLRCASTSIRRVIDAGCGAGPLSAALDGAGFDVTGVDVSADLLAVARERVPRASFFEGSVYDFPMPPCQAIVAIGEALTYHDDSSRADGTVQEFFGTAAATLPTGGLLIFDIIETGEPSLDGRTWRSGEDWAVLAETVEDRPARKLTRSIETFRRIDGGSAYRRSREIHKVRIFDTSVLSLQLAKAGFAVETAQHYGAAQLLPRRRAFFCTQTA
jgi:SAM-dependent methyltransferase